jgi:hypothetical protein
MAQGFETRGVTEFAGPSGQANVPARQLQQVTVRAPMGGSMRLSQGNMRALETLGRLGGEAITKYIKDKQAKEEVAQEMLYSQGASEQEFTAAGYSREDYRSLSMKDNYNKWFTQSVAEANTTYAHLSPDEYRNVLSTQFEDVLGGLDPNDDVSRDVFTTMGKEGFSKLVRNQAAANIQYTHQQAAYSLQEATYSEINAGSVDDIKEFVTNVSTYAPNISQDMREEALAAGIARAAEEGNFKAYDALGGKSGLAAYISNPNIRDRVEGAVEQGMQKRTQDTAFSRLDTEMGIIRMVADGKLTPTEAFERFKTTEKENRLSNGYAYGMVNSIANAYSRNVSSQEESERLDKTLNPSFRKEFADFLTEVEFQGLENDDLEQLTRIGKKYDVDPTMLTQMKKDVSNAHGQYENNRKREFETVIAQQQKQKKTRQAATILATQDPLTWETSGASSEIQQLALSTLQQSAALQAAQEAETRKSNDPNFDTDTYVSQAVALTTADALSRTTIVDKKLQELFSVVGHLTEPYDEQRNIRPEVQEAARYFNALKDKGFSSGKLKEYAGDAYPVLLAATDVFKAVDADGNVSDLALAQAYAPTPTEPPNKLEVRSKVLGKWPAHKERIRAEFEPTAMESWEANPTDATYDQVYTDEVKRAFTDPTVDRYFERVVGELQQEHPYAGQQWLLAAATARVRDMKYVGGRLFEPDKSGITVTDKMGIAGYDGRLMEQKAFVLHLAAQKDLIHKPVEEGGWGIPRTSLPPEATSLFELFLNIGAQGREEVQSDYAFMMNRFAENGQRIRNGMKNLKLVPAGPDAVVVHFFSDENHDNYLGQSSPIAWKTIGDTFKQSVGTVAREATRSTQTNNK